MVLGIWCASFVSILTTSLWDGHYFYYFPYELGTGAEDYAVDEGKDQNYAQGNQIGLIP